MNVRGGLLLGTAAVAVVAGVAYATGAIGSGAPHAIVGCAKNQNGQLRIVIDAAQCLASEHSVTFAAPQPPVGPTVLTVDCSAGQSLQQAINTADPVEPLSITVKGTCTEAVALFRDHVTLVAAASGGGIQAPSGGEDPALVVGGRDVTLQALELAAPGGQSLVAAEGAVVQTQDLRVTGAVGVGQSSSLGLVNATVADCGGVQADTGGSIFVDGGSITGCGVKALNGGSIRLTDGVSVMHARFVGADAGNGGSIAIDGATLSGNGNVGVLAENGGTAMIDSGTISGNTSAGVNAVNGGSIGIVDAQISGNGKGATAEGGHLDIESGAVIEHNIGAGVRLIGASSLHIGGGAVVQNNGGDGISLSDTSVATLLGATVSGNARHGIECDGPPSVAVFRGPSDGVTGNTQSDVACQNAGQPG
jgi:hypothetical protein